jgi:hypothetical protein
MMESIEQRRLQGNVPRAYSNALTGPVRSSSLGLLERGSVRWTTPITALDLRMRVVGEGSFHSRETEKLMKTAEDIESYMIQMGVQFETLGDGVWMIRDIEPGMVLSIADSVIAFRIKVMALDQVPQARREELYRSLLELNAGDMLHGAYGLEQGAVVVTDALQLENLDYNEFQATVDDMGMAVRNHYPTLSQFIA